MILTALLAAGSMAAHGQTPKITLSFASLPITYALEKISKQSGLTLKASRPMESQLLYASLHDADPKRMLQVIAKALDAKWSHDGDTWTLEPDFKAEQARDNAVYASEIATWRGSMAYLKRRIASEPQVFDEQAARTQRLHQQSNEAGRKEAERRDDFARMFQADPSEEETPAWRAGAHIALLLDENEVIKMPYRSRQVWSQRPTQAQTLLPLEATQVLETYKQELAVFKPQAAVGRVKFVLTRWESGGQFSADFEALGPGGVKVDEASLRLANDMDILAKPGGHTFVPPPPRPDEKPVALPDEAKEQLEVMDTNGHASPAIRAKWTAILTDPLKNEPLRILESAKYVAAADQVGLDLIGVPDEQTFLRFQSLNSAQVRETPSQLFARIKAECTVEPDGWVIVRPERSTPRLSRELGGAILRDTLAQGGVSVDDAASWAGADPYEFPFIDWLGDAIQALFKTTGGYSPASATNDEVTLRLWDAIGNSRLALRQGNTVSLTSLSPEAQRMVQEHVFWYGALGDAEPTELFPNGIQGGTVRLTTGEKPIFMASSSQNPSSAPQRVYDAQQFGKAMATGGAQKPAAYFQSLDQFRMGVYRTYTLHFSLLPGAKAFDLAVSESMISPEADRLDKLPQAISAQVDAAKRAQLAKPAATKSVDLPPPK